MAQLLTWKQKFLATAALLEVLCIFDACPASLLDLKTYIDM